jgi:hypothetical protein
MTEQEALKRLAACRDIVELLETNIREDRDLPQKGLTSDQLDRLEQFGEVYPRIYISTDIRNKTGISREQLELLRKQVPLIEQYRIEKRLKGHKE